MIANNPTYVTSFYALSLEQIASIWQERVLPAVNRAAVRVPGEQMCVALVRLGEELFGLNAEYVSDIRPQAALTRAQDAPEWVLGVIDLRGRALPVIDLRRCLGLPPAAQPGPLAFVTVTTPEQEVIFLVDEAHGVEALPVRQNLSGMRLPACGAAVVERPAGPGEQPYVAVLDIKALLAEACLIVR